MAKKIIGWLLTLFGVLALIIGFIEVSGGASDGPSDILFGIFILGLGIYLISTSKKKDASISTPTKRP